MKILLAGGGSGGAFLPLLALVEELKAQEVVEQKEDFLWIGTRNGPEETMVKWQQIPFRKIFSGKFRRYLSLKNIFDPFFVFLGFLESLWHIFRFEPDVVVSVGGFVSVPVVWAAWIMRKKILIHQQDRKKGLANRMVIWCADRITVTLEESLKDFPQEKTILTGNAVRSSLFDGNLERARGQFHIETQLPILLITGGGTGARHLNKIVSQAAPELVEFAEVIHLTGKGKKVLFEKSILQQYPLLSQRYRQYEFLGLEMKDALLIAQIIISRAGMSTLSELSLLKKTTIIVPLPQTHQEENARFFERKNAVVLYEEKDLTPEGIVLRVKELLGDPLRRKELRENIGKIMPRDGARKIVEALLQLMNDDMKKEKI